MISGKKAAPWAIFSSFVSPPLPTPTLLAQSEGLVHVNPAVLPHLLSAR